MNSLSEIIIYSTKRNGWIINDNRAAPVVYPSFELALAALTMLYA